MADDFSAITTQPRTQGSADLSEVPKEVAQATAEAVPYIDTQPKPAAASSGDVPGRVYEADYLEIYSIGGSVKVRWWNKKVSKKVEQNSFQEVDAIWGGDCARTFLEMCEMIPAQCDETRHSYKVTGARADEHPAFDTYFKKKKKCCCIAYKDELPTRRPFPETAHGNRGTPGAKPITDFSAPIMANERGPLWEPGCFGNERGFKLRFKTRKGGETLFYVRRNHAAWQDIILRCAESEEDCPDSCKPCVELFCMPCRTDFAKSFGTLEGREIEIYDADGVTLLGKVRDSEQWLKTDAGACARCRSEEDCGQGPRCCCCMTYFPYRAEPVLDILNPDGKILYTMLWPKELKTRCCCIKVPENKDYFAVVPGPRRVDATIDSGATGDDAGWVIHMRPKCAKCLDLVTQAVISIPGTDKFLKVIQSFLICCQMCPLDNITQVPNPGRKGLRNTTPLSHVLNAFRAKVPPGASENDKKLLIASMIALEFENQYIKISE